MTNHQRKGSTSNAHAGRDFERDVKSFFEEEENLRLEGGIAVEIGIGERKKTHKWDLGCDNKKILIECKSHKWTESDKIPSAKLTTWDQAMYYMHLAPDEYKKIFCCLKDMSIKRRKTLADYYIEKHGHLIPPNVEIWEFCDKSKTAEKKYPL